MKKVLTFGVYLKRKFHKKIYKLPVSIPSFTCPNIDGTVAKGGCTYCDNESFSPNLQRSGKKNPTDNSLLEYQIASLKEQIAKSSKNLREIKGAEGFIVYFQSFTNTYAPLETLKALYEFALAQKDVVGLSIGTRVDCVDDELLAYLKQLSLKKEIWIEYGVQSIHDKTLQRINRGHLSDKLNYWIPRTKALGLNVCAHLIFGLYDESEEMMLESVKKCVEWGVDAYKFHPLYVVKGTKMANELACGEFETLSIEKYSKILALSLKMLPKGVIIQRISAGARDDTLVSPLWCRDKNVQTDSIKKLLEGYGITI